VYASVALTSAVLLAQVALGVVIVTNFRRAVAPPSAALVEAARSAGGWEEVRFATEDGLTLRGELFGEVASRPVVVFGHGYGMRRRMADRATPALLTNGYSILTFDFRGSGASDGRFTTVGALEERDIRAAVRFLRRDRGVAPKRIGIVGVSMGAAASAMAAQSLSDLGAVVLIAPYAGLEEAANARTERWAGLPARPWFAPAMMVAGLLSGADPHAARPVDRIGELEPCPILILGGEQDWRAPVADLRRLEARSGQHHSLVVLPGMDHNELCSFKPPVLQLVEEFLAAHVPSTSSGPQ
jgi:pimeloyl-ACP methyl ester carboxylesterase